MIPRTVLALAFAALASGCASLYVEQAGPAPEPGPQLRLATWPKPEYWCGLVFNGEKIGFSHLALAPAPDSPERYEIRSEAAFALRFLGYEKRIEFKAFDVVQADLELVRFHYDYTIDGSEMALSGERRGASLEVTIRHAGEVTTQTLAAGGPIYPQSAITLYPALHGLVSGRAYKYRVYSGELQKIAEVTQRVGAYERSPSLFEGAAFRMETEMQGYRTQTWINTRGQPVLEIGMNGVLISGLESEERAKRYLAAASLNKAEALIDFALVRTEHPLARPRQILRMRIALSGADRAVPSDATQRCARQGAETLCEVAPDAAATSGPPAVDASDPRYLASTLTVPARNPAIAATARKIVGGTTDAHERIRRILAWIGQNVGKSPADVFSALDVLEKREAECQGHTYLYAAFARALGIPTRVVNGIAYSEDYQGFLYHTWAESLVGGRWLAVDPTFGTAPTDATHVKLVEGETLDQLTPLVDWVGRLKVRVLAVEER
jgi:Transglutaminase-like superfamily